MSSPTLELDEDDVDDSSVDSGPLSKKMKLTSSGDFSIYGIIVVCITCTSHAFIPMHNMQV